MAENKSSFILYCDQKALFDRLTNEEAGELIKHIFAYVNDECPIAPNRTVEIAFEPIKQQFKRDLKRWEGTRSKRSVAGKIGAERRWQKTDQKIELPKPPQIVFPIEECAQIALRDERWAKANKTNEMELKKFNEYLEKQGSYEYNPYDYKRYFSKLKGKYPDMVRKVLTAEEFKQALQ